MRRSTDEPELMDDPDCDPVALDRTFAQFRLVNAALSGWRGTYRRHLRPVLRRAAAERGQASLLDVGSGGGDVARALARWARADGIPVTVTGTDPDPRALAFVRRVDGLARGAGAGTAPGVGEPEADGAGPLWRGALSSELVAAHEVFDVVVSNHVLHHIDDDELASLLADTAALTRGIAVHGDLRRSRLAWTTWWVLTLPLLRARSFLRFDGLLSIRRSRTIPELRELVTAHLPDVPWEVRGHGASRALLILRPGR